MSPQERRIAKGERVLVTGANGYIASHVVDVLLEEGYHVRGTIRAEKPWLDKYFSEKYGHGKYESIVVPAMEAESAFDEAIKGVSGLVHVASDLSVNPDPNAVIPKVIAGTQNLLKAAAKESSVKSFVLTSSSSAAYLNVPGPPKVIDEDSWNDAAVEAAWSDETPQEVKGLVVYAASKTEGERQAWQWVKDNKPSYAFNVVLPPFNTGTIFTPEIFGSSMGYTRQLLEGNDFIMKILPPHWYVDVDDCARIHIAALLDNKVQSQRLFAFASEFNWTDMLAVLKKLRPENKTLPNPPENERRDRAEIKPRGKAEGLLKSFYGEGGYKGLEESVADGIEGVA